MNPAPARIPYLRGLHPVGERVWAWTLPDGGYGWSNAGLIAGDGASLLVDTLFDLHLTREMLFRDAALHRRRAHHRRRDHPLQRRSHPRQPIARPLGPDSRRERHRRGSRPRDGAGDADDDAGRRPRSGRNALCTRTIRALRFQRHHTAQRRPHIRARDRHRRRRQTSASARPRARPHRRRHRRARARRRRSVRR